MKKIEHLTSIEMIEDFIKNHKFSYIYISRPDCGVCHAVLPQLRDLLDKFPLIQLGQVNADNVEEVAAKYSVLTVPSLLLFVDGKEVLRAARFVHFDELERNIERVYGIYNRQ